MIHFNQKGLLMKIWTLFAGMVLASTTSLSAFDLKNDISVVGGYQHGRFDQTNFINLKSAGIFPAGGEQVDSVESRIDLGIVGIDGRLVMPHLDCCCNYPFLNNFYVTGHAIWGFSDGNKFSEETTANFPTGIPQPALYENTKALATGKLKDAQTYDFEVGLGYFLDFSRLCYFSDILNGWALGIEGGYSYHKQALKTKHGDLGVFSSVPLHGQFFEDFGGYNGTKYHNKWSGGWVGAELFYESCAWDIALGYQYHIVEYKGINNTSATGLTQGLTDTSLHSNDAHGNVWTAKANYDVWCGWRIGAIFNYEYWHAKNGGWHLTAPHSTAEGFGTNDFNTSVDASWNAWSVAGTISYEF